MVDPGPPLSRQKPYPVETLRHRYVTPFGGRSDDLQPGQVGIHAWALNQNTTLVPDQDAVLISIVGDGVPRPLFTQRPFQVVALDRTRPDGLQKSPHGEAVLPFQALGDEIRLPHLQPTHGQPLLLNGVTARIFGTDPATVLGQLMGQALRHPKGPSR